MTRFYHILRQNRLYILLFITFYSKFNQFDGFNVFSGHIRQRFHLLSLSQPGKAISAGHLVRVG